MSSHDGRYYAITFRGAASVSGVEGAVLEIKDRVTGEVGIFIYAGASASYSIPVLGALEAPSGEAALFQTATPQTLRDFEGMARIWGTSAGPLDVVRGIQFSDDKHWDGDMDVVHDGFLATVVYGDSVDISGTTSGPSPDLKWGVVNLTLVDTRQEQPDPGLLDGLADVVDRGREIAEHHLEGQTEDLEHAAAEVHAQQSLPADEQPVSYPEANAEHIAAILQHGQEVVDHHLEGQTADLAHAAAEVHARQSLLTHDPEVAAHAQWLFEAAHGAAEFEAQQSLPIDGAPGLDDVLLASGEVDAQQSFPHEPAPGTPTVNDLPADFEAGSVASQGTDVQLSPGEAASPQFEEAASPQFEGLSPALDSFSPDDFAAPDTDEYAIDDP